MKTQIKKGIKTLAVMSLLQTGVAAPTAVLSSEKVYASTQEVKFSDVPNTHWGIDSIKWATKNGVIKGYGNGKFGPEDTMSEAEFLTMITNYLNLKQGSGSTGKHWADAVYNTAADYGIGLWGYDDIQARNQPITRGLVADIITYLVHADTTLGDAIDFLVDNNITKGTNPDYRFIDYEVFFGTYDHLSRAQGVTFIHRMEQAGFNKVREDLNVSSKPIEKPVTQAGAIVNNYEEYKAEVARLFKEGKKEFTIEFAPGVLSEGKVTLNEAYFVHADLANEGSHYGHLLDRVDTKISGDKITQKYELEITESQEKELMDFVKKHAKEINSKFSTDRDKVIAVSTLISNKATYASVRDTQGSVYHPYTIVSEGKGVCEAYTLLGNLMFEELGIESLYVSGTLPTGSHAWNLVSLDGEWYHIDITGGSHELRTTAKLKSLNYKWNENNYPKAQ